LFQIFAGFFMLAVAEAVRMLLFVQLKQKPKGVAMALARVVGGMVGVVAFGANIG